MRVVVAPDSFKGSMSATQAADAIARGWSLARPGDTLELLPQADGGEGTTDAVARAVAGTVVRHVGPVVGPASTPVPGDYLLLPDGTAVVELARMSGLLLMPRPDPVGATTYGLGQVIAAALDDGCARLVVALGGSASTDGGQGAVLALGARTPPAGGAELLVDVDNPLLGPRGAAAVFGPQKGATHQQVALLEARLTQLAERLDHDPSIPGAGAAGGTAYGLSAWGARIVPGAATISAMSGLTHLATGADLVVTGEGRFDDQSLSGKVVGHVLSLGCRVAIVAGAIDRIPVVPAVALVDVAGSVAAAFAAPERWAAAAARRLAAGIDE